MLKKIINSKKKVSQYFEKWSPDDDINSLLLLFKRQDKKGLEIIFEADIKNLEKKFADPPFCTLQEV